MEPFDVDLTPDEFIAVKRDFAANERTMRPDGSNPVEPSGPALDALVVRLTGLGWTRGRPVRVRVRRQ